MEQVKMVKCPTCQQEVAWRPESEFRPFCSKRCKLIDLGAWADEQYTVASETPQDWEESDLKR